MSHLANASKAVMDHVDDEDKRFEMLPVSDSQNGNLVKTALINESGLEIAQKVQKSAHKKELIRQGHRNHEYGVS